MRYDLESMLPEMAFQPRGRGPFARGMTLEGGGKGGGGSTNSKTETSNIPEYARPYVENMMGATQKQLFNIEPGKAAQYDAAGNMTSEATSDQITGFKPYQAYSTNAADYVAGFSPLQQQAMQGMGNMQVANQIGQGTQFANQAGIGSFGLGNQAAMTGQNYAAQATNPYAMQAYMSPYMQNVTDVQKSAAMRDYAKALPGMKAQAVGQGAFGGNRMALQEAEAQRGLMSQLQGIEAQGTQQAFQNAQQAQQYGANLGLQGLSTGLQGYNQALQAGSTLGQLGQSQYGQQMGILEGQAKAGALQQQQEQMKINQSIQDWANTQQYPLMQLGVMSNMLRGLPMQGVTTNQYVPQANSLTQGIGTAGAAASLYNATKGSASGGVVKSMAGGGIASVPSYDVGGEIESKLYDMPPEDLARYKDQTTSPTVKRMIERILREETGKAGGGIIAFKDSTDENNQSLVKEDPAAVAKAYRDAAVMNSFKQEPKPYVERPVVQTAPTPVAEVPVERADPALVRQAQIDSALLRGGNQNMPKNLQYVEGVTDRKQFLNPDSVLAQNATRKNLAGTGLSVEEDVAKQKIQQDLIESGAQRKGIKAKQFADLPADQQAKFFAAIEGKQPTTNVPTSISSPEDAAKLGPAYKVGDKPTGIKTAPSTGVGIKPNTGIVPNIGGVKGPTGPTGLELTEKIPTIKETAAEREAYIGPNTAAQEQRANLMAEKANSKDEAFRQTSMRMAEFFAAWGSTPGNTVVAGLNALKNKVPDFISDKKEQKRIEREINNSIYDIDKAQRLEKAGNYDEAAKIIEKAKDRAEKKYGYDLTYAASLNRDATSIKVAEIGREGRVEAAGGKGAFKSIQDAENALDKHIAEGNKIGSAYYTDKSIVKARQSDYAAGKLDPKQKMQYESALKNVQSFEGREKELRDNVNYFKQNKGMPTASSTSSSESSGVDLNNYWKK